MWTREIGRAGKQEKRTHFTVVQILIIGESKHWKKNRIIFFIIVVIVVGFLSFFCCLLVRIYAVACVCRICKHKLVDEVQVNESQKPYFHHKLFHFYSLWRQLCVFCVCVCACIYVRNCFLRSSSYDLVSLCLQCTLCVYLSTPYANEAKMSSFIFIIYEITVTHSLCCAYKIFDVAC